MDKQIMERLILDLQFKDLNHLTLSIKLWNSFFLFYQSRPVFICKKSYSCYAIRCFLILYYSDYNDISLHYNN